MLIYAHRGASAHAPENTLLAIEVALAQQADGIELDVYQLDDEFVVIHDKWLHRTTNGIGQLSDYSLVALRQLDAGQHQQIPTLAEAMSLIGGQCMLNIEMKGVHQLKHFRDYTEACEQRYAFITEQLTYSSFDHHLLAALKGIAPEVRIGALTAGKPLQYAQFASELNAYSVHADVTFIDPPFVKDAHQRGLKVMVYTVDEKQDLLTLRDWGVDGVFTNRPDFAKEVLS